MYKLFVNISYEISAAQVDLPFEKMLPETFYVENTCYQTHLAFFFSPVLLSATFTMMTVSEMLRKLKNNFFNSIQIAKALKR